MTCVFIYVIYCKKKKGCPLHLHWFLFSFNVNIWCWCSVVFCCFFLVLMYRSHQTSTLANHLQRACCSWSAIIKTKKKGHRGRDIIKNESCKPGLCHFWLKTIQSSVMRGRFNPWFIKLKEYHVSALPHWFPLELGDYMIIVLRCFFLIYQIYYAPAVNQRRWAWLMRKDVLRLLCVFFHLYIIWFFIFDILN